MQTHTRIHMYLFSESAKMQRHRQNKYVSEHIVRNKGSYSSRTHMHQHTLSWWEDLHLLPINKSVSLETCGPPSLSFCHTHIGRGQGQKGMSGGSEGNEGVLASMGVQADDTVWRVKALLCGWGVGSLHVSVRSWTLTPPGLQKDKAVSTVWTVATN